MFAATRSYWVPDATSTDPSCTVTQSVSSFRRTFSRALRTALGLVSTPSAVETAEQVVDEALAARTLAVGDAPVLIGTAGTATALALVHAGPASTWDALHGSGFVLSREDVRDWRERLLGRSVDGILELHPEAMAGRADVFPMGVILLDRVLAHYDLDDLRVSPYELRHGLTLRLLASAPASPS